MFLLRFVIKLGTNRGSRVAQTNLKGFKRDPEKVLTRCRKLEFAQGSWVPQYTAIQSTIQFGRANGVWYVGCGVWWVLACMYSLKPGNLILFFHL